LPKTRTDGPPPTRNPRTNSTLFDEIRGTLTRAIVDGEYKPGDRLPTEQQLAERFRASRPTVNKAIGSLATEGLVVRRKRAGTIVLAQSAFWLPMVDVSRYVGDLGQAYRFELLSQSFGTNGAGGLNWSDAPEGARLLALECLHFGDTVPVQHERRLINLETVPEAANAKFQNTPPGPWLLRHVPWSASEHRIGAIGAGEALATLFGVRRGTPCLGIQRITRHHGAPLTTVTLTSPAGRFFLEGAYAPVGDLV
jgi:GntR family transcriptional regulator, histidine utilization repressor